MQECKVTAVLVPPIQKPDVLLTMDWDTAQAMLSICARVSGWPSGTRGRMDKLRSALVGAGVTRNPLDAGLECKWLTGSINFSDGDPDGPRP